MKTVDFNDEFDEEYSEFEAFMARKELKLISRRMQRGKIKSIEEGKFIAQAPPYGYDIKYLNNKERVLVINEDKATVVKIIFDMYLKGDGSCFPFTSICSSIPLVLLEFLFLSTLFHTIYPQYTLFFIISLIPFSYQVLPVVVL